VVEEGVLQAGDEIVVESRPAHGVTVSTMFRAFMSEPHLLPLLLDVEGLPERVYEVARERSAPQQV
jgi:MOSC domain-containing protein YiiM